MHSDKVSTLCLLGYNQEVCLSRGKCRVRRGNLLTVTATVILRCLAVSVVVNEIQSMQDDVFI